MAMVQSVSVYAKALYFYVSLVMGGYVCVCVCVGSILSFSSIFHPFTVSPMRVVMIEMDNTYKHTHIRTYNEQKRTLFHFALISLNPSLEEKYNQNQISQALNASRQSSSKTDGSRRRVFQFILTIKEIIS